MEIQISRNGQEFLDTYTKIMMQQEVLYLLLMGNAQKQKDVEACGESLYGAVVDDGRPVLLFGNRMPYRLLIYRMTEGDITEAVQLLVDYIHEHQIPIAGVLASDAICQQFLTLETTGIYKRGHGMDIMELRHLKDVPVTSGRFRKAELSELEQLTKWHQDFRVDCGLTDRLVSYEEERKNVMENIINGTCYVYENMHGELVSMASISRKLNQGVCVSGVYTPPSQRGHGYCTALMHHLAKAMLDSGYKYLGLFVDKENPISNHTYEKVGYRIIVDSIEYDRTEAL